MVATVFLVSGRPRRRSRSRSSILSSLNVSVHLANVDHSEDANSQVGFGNCDDPAAQWQRESYCVWLKIRY